MSVETICSELHALVHGLPRYPFPPPEEMPSDGVYFVFEAGEVGHGGARIVRIGSHTGAGNLAARLREHLTDNKDRSIFRKNVGRALLNRDRDPFLKDWDLDLTSRDKRERFGHQVDAARQREVENAVTAHIQAQMSVSVIPMPDSSTALRFERLCIGTVSRCISCVPSQQWLGRFSPVQKIRDSALWQVQHLLSEPLSEDDLRELRRYAAVGNPSSSKPTKPVGTSQSTGRPKPPNAVQNSDNHDGIELNDLLASRGIDAQRVLVMRHRPFEPELRKVLPWLAAEKPDVFNAYQQVQGEKVEKAMLGAAYIASFIGHEPGKALFIGLYTIDGSSPMTVEEFWNVPANQEMKAFGMKGFTGDERSSVLWFDLTATEHFASWKGKLIVDWPGLERSWWRWADRNSIAVRAILEESLLDAAMPSWERINLNWEDLRVLPSRWKSALSQWRGIYYIFDTEAGKGYVGSAYGEDNLLGRWLNYSATGHGGNTLLRKRDPRAFTFTILQRVSPDMEPDDVIRVESTWKDRLHSRAPHGLNDN